ncbi:MAG: CpsD/CapB family tyrosine-protein kinase [Rhodobacteraceae bacterium]|nr:CpsD/CapB family tyrosine-protein kinase [Paracoccaceae bacterium]
MRRLKHFRRKDETDGPGDMLDGPEPRGRKPQPRYLDDADHDGRRGGAPRPQPRFVDADPEDAGARAPRYMEVEPPGPRVAPPQPEVNHPIADPHAVSWTGLPEVRLNVRKKAGMRMPLAGFFRDDPASKAFDLLRTRLVQTLRANRWSRIAIAAPTSGCGSTFTAVNLALSMARVPSSRTILMDLNQRDPGVADALEVGDVGDMTAYLSGKLPTSQFIMRCSKTLALGVSRRTNKNAAELLHDPAATQVLDRMTGALQPDVTIFDMPPVLQYDDLAALLPMIDGVLLVSDGTKTTARDIAECERILEGQTQLLGVILNRARRSSVQRFDA